jgi:hypothetical protein
MLLFSSLGWAELQDMTGPQLPQLDVLEKMRTQPPASRRLQQLPDLDQSTGCQALLMNRSTPISFIFVIKALENAGMTHAKLTPEERNFLKASVLLNLMGRVQQGDWQGLIDADEIIDFLDLEESPWANQYVAAALYWVGQISYFLNSTAHSRPVVTANPQTGFARVTSIFGGESVVIGSRPKDRAKRVAVLIENMYAAAIDAYIARINPHLAEAQIRDLQQLRPALARIFAILQTLNVPETGFRPNGFKTLIRFLTPLPDSLPPL